MLNKFGSPKFLRTSGGISDCFSGRCARLLVHAVSRRGRLVNVGGMGNGWHSNTRLGAVRILVDFPIGLRITRSLHPQQLLFRHEPRLLKMPLNGGETWCRIQVQ